uniref:Biotin-protein ligase N-terminal domain-containing protein n=1 Tax=Mucochytrium quahogii TaxID=96639 RepID=A0A7S2WJS2_9STRA|mmetsp:Transcript_27822/g.44536  ORF Transcript_27822/g.44536 Transcript_27822/m.44536 type:complete len:314 (+) Transcript_27822:734-1675(+)
MRGFAGVLACVCTLFVVHPCMSLQGVGFRDQLILENVANGPIRIAFYNGTGSTKRARANVPHVLESCGGEKIQLERFSEWGLRQVTLDRYDVLLIPGGTDEVLPALKHANPGLDVKQHILNFVTAGGGYVGICEGAIVAHKLGMTTKIVNGMEGDGYLNEVKFASADVPDLLQIEDTAPNGRRVYYANGPFFEHTPTMRKGDVFTYAKPLLRVSSSPSSFTNIVSNEEQSHPKWTKQLVKNRGETILLLTGIGKGRVVASTAHPETEIKGTLSSWVPVNPPSQCNTFQADLLLSYVFVAAKRARYPRTISELA